MRGRMLAAGLGILLLSFFGMSSASGAVWIAAPSTEQQKLEWSLPAARYYWKTHLDSGRCNREKITLNATKRLIRDHQGPVDGDANPTTCTIRIRANLSLERFCVVLTHELGHLYGLGHSEDPHSVMYYSGAATEECAKPVKILSIDP